MACLRGIITKRANVLQRRAYPSCGHLIHDDRDETKSDSSSDTTIRKVLARNGSSNYKLSSRFEERHYYQSFASGSLGGLGLSSCRYMSSTQPEWSDKVDGIDFVATEIVPDEIVEAVTTTSQAVPAAVNEVAIAAADSAFPVAALQHLIDGVHSFTGLNWWASIALTTVLIRGVTVPILLNQLKATYKLNVLRPQLEELRREMSTKAQDPEAMAEGQRRMQLLFKEHGVTPFTPLKGLIIQGPIFISFFFAIRNMAEKVPSFKTGGTLWFTDLTTADTTYILPLLTAATFLIMVESNMQEGLEGNPVAGTMKKFSRIIAFLSIPVLIGIEKALFCYWLTSNLFTLVYGLTLRRPDVRKLLNLPDVVNSSTRQPSPSSSSPLPFTFPEPKDQSVAQEKPPVSPSSSESSSSVPDRRISRSSVLNQRIRSLERQLKDRKNKK
ncbi:PREDICTED: mitochondrial inner membrane protein OXA1-like [Camelina sativa]|uniref:Mitochondrial inner membrane protein OXA1-like n=1 Tax=Camelina sativa TaxID=90675 RepID=A0ABM0YYR5_CAMSA|nr:PREDICTED: mitochondrial inner membrane protein OXA1-like [Camelina sativa]XP_010508014.1 PREDICTED: mitochondrial inner membrane protein OXA1-like [Camelina sativa]